MKPNESMNEKGYIVTDLTKRQPMFVGEIQNLFGDIEELKPISGDVLDYLNEKKPSKIPYKKTHSNLKDIESRIREKFKVEDFKLVIDFKIREWKDNLKMKKYIRPATLFGTKFNQYLVESEEHRRANDGSKNFEYNPQDKAQLL